MKGRIPRNWELSKELKVMTFSPGKQTAGETLSDEKY